MQQSIFFDRTLNDMYSFDNFIEIIGWVLTLHVAIKVK